MYLYKGPGASAKLKPSPYFEPKIVNRFGFNSKHSFYYLFEAYILIFTQIQQLCTLCIAQLYTTMHYALCNMQYAPKAVNGFGFNLKHSYYNILEAPGPLSAKSTKIK